MLMIIVFVCNGPEVVQRVLDCLVNEGRKVGLVINPQAPGEGEISSHSQAIFSKLKNEDKDLFSFRNCKK